MACTLKFEKQLWARGARLVGGMDEAGRGCLAGAVFAAVVIVPPQFRHRRLNDSKQVCPRLREELYEELRADGRLRISCASASAEEIDAINILRASHLAMERAVRALPEVPDGLLVDGLPIKNFPFTHEAVIEGDARCLSIAAASIIAKVERDRYMAMMALEFAVYGFQQHKGYGTLEHREALLRHGPCSIHRKTFAPVALGIAASVLRLA